MASEEDLRIAREATRNHMDRRTLKFIGREVYDDLVTAIARVRAEQREDSARIADGFQSEGESAATLQAHNLTAAAIAEAIRVGDKE